MFDASGFLCGCNTCVGSFEHGPWFTESRSALAPSCFRNPLGTQLPSFLQTLNK